MKYAIACCAILCTMNAAWAIPIASDWGIPYANLSFSPPNDLAGGSGEFLLRVNISIIDPPHIPVTYGSLGFGFSNSSRNAGSYFQLDPVEEIHTSVGENATGSQQNNVVFLHLPEMYGSALWADVPIIYAHAPADEYRVLLGPAFLTVEAIEEGWTWDMQVTSQPATFSVTPEPTTITILGLGLMGFVALKRRYFR